MSLQPLFTPLDMGDLDLPNRIVMAPHPHARWVDGSRADRAAGRILCPAGFGWTDRRGSDRNQC
jgi:2,4-dienoyl-CoA reductase-like NADH-dependent reductase (Old Yellow Enzyme family)